MFASLRFRRHRERLYTWLIAIGGILLAAGAAMVASDYARKAADESFRREVAPRAAAIEGAVARHVQITRSLAAFMSGRGEASAADFRSFVDVMRADVAGIQALQWMPRVSEAERAAFEAQADADLPGFRITGPVDPWLLDESMAREHYFPVRYVEPLMGNERVLGQDIAAGEQEAAALSKALQVHDVAATGRLALIQDDGVYHGVLLVAPVFNGGGELRGYVGALLRIDVALEAAFAGMPPVGLLIHVTDASDPGSERALHVFSDRLTVLSDLLKVSTDVRPKGVAAELLAMHEVSVANRTWRVYMEPGPGYFPPVPPVPTWLAALAVLLVTAIITTLLLLMQKRAQLLARSSLSDGLTGLANRAFCDRMLLAEWERAVRHGKWLSVLVIDVDHFADYNDQLGPLAGDDCLRRIAGVLATVPSRASDIPCRYSGDRFALVLPETDHEGARQLGERIRKAVRELRLAHPGRTPEPVVTISVIAASVRPRRGNQLASFVGEAVDLLDMPERGDGDVLLGLSADDH